MGREAARVLREIQTPQDQYNQKVAKLKTLLDANKLSQDQYNAAVAKAKDKLDQAGKSGEQAFGAQAIGFAKQLAGALGLGAGVAGAVQLVRKEYEAMIETQRLANQLSQTAAQAQETALTNLGAQTAEDRDAFVSQVKALSAGLGVSEAEVYKRASDALSARGEQSVEAAMGAVRASFAFAPGDTAAGIAASGAALDISGITGGTAEQSLGFLQAVGQRARITDPRRLAVNMPPAIMSAVANGADIQTAGAMYAALTQGMSDITGESSRTAAIALSQQLREFQGGEGWQNLSMRDRIARLQQDEKLRTAFIADTSFEKRAQTPIEQLLGGGATGRAYQTFLRDLPNMQTAGEQFTKGAEIKAGADLQRVAQFQRATKGGLEQLATQDPKRAMLGALREDYGNILRQAGVPKIAADLDELQSSDIGDFTAGLRNQARRLMGRHGGAAGPGPSYGVNIGALSESDQEQAKILFELANRLDRITEATEKHAAAAAALDQAAENLRRATETGPALVAPGEDR